MQPLNNLKHVLPDIPESLNAVQRGHLPYVNKEWLLIPLNAGQWSGPADLRSVRSANLVHRLTVRPTGRTGVRHRPWPRVQIRQKFFDHYKSRPIVLYPLQTIATVLRVQY